MFYDWCGQVALDRAFARFPTGFAAMTDNSREQTDLSSQAELVALKSLQQEIRLHQRDDANQSVLTRGIGTVWNKFQSEALSLVALKSFYREAERKLKTGDVETKAQTVKEIARVVEADRQAIESRATVTHYAGGFLKTAGLFLSGRIGVTSTVGVYSLDQWNPSLSWKEQVADATLGGLKGGGMKAMFHVLGHHSQTAVAKGVMLGIGNSVLDVGLSRNSYKDGFGKGLSDTLISAVDPRARAIDGAVFVASEGMFRGANHFSRGAVRESPMLSTMFTGAAFGMSSGGVGEYMRQKQAGEQLDLQKIVQHAAIQGLVDTAAASFGGLQADTQLRARMNESVQRMNLNMRERANQPQRHLQSAVDWLINRSQWTPALVGIPAGFGGQVRLPESIRPVATTPESPTRLTDLIPNVVYMSTGLGLGYGDSIGSSRASLGSTTSGVGRRECANHAHRTDCTSASAQSGKIIIEVPQALVPAANELNKLAKNLTDPTAAESDRQAVSSFLRANRELREFACMLADVKKVPVLTSIVNEVFQGDGLPMFRTYRTARGDKNTYELWKELQTTFFPSFRMEKFAASYRGAVSSYLSMYPELRPATEHFANKCEDLAIVESLDIVLGTKYASALRTRGKGAEPKLAVPLAGEAKAEAGDSKLNMRFEPTVLKALTSGVMTSSIVGELSPKVRAKGESSVNAAEKNAPETKVPLSAAENTLLERVNTLTVGTPEARAVAAKELVPEIDKLSDQAFLRWLQAIDSPEAMALALESTKGGRVPRIVRVLGDRLFELSDRSFLRWKEIAQARLLDGWKLDVAAVDALPLAVQKEFLSKIPSLEAQREHGWRRDSGNRSAKFVLPEAIVPDWAKDHVVSAQKPSGSGGGDRVQRRQPWKPRFIDTLDNRIDLLGSAVEALKTAPASMSPDLKHKLIRLGCSDKEGLLGVFDAVGYRQIGRDAPFSWVEADPRIEANRRLLAELAPQATSMEPLKYLFQFLRERNAAGAYVAAQEMQPATTAAKSLSAVRAELVQTKQQAGEPIDNDRIDVEARRKLSQLTREASQRWTDVRKLISNLASGRI
jgi:hypothetical protein